MRCSSLRRPAWSLVLASLEPSHLFYRINDCDEDKKNDVKSLLIYGGALIKDLLSLIKASPSKFNNTFHPLRVECSSVDTSSSEALH